MRTQTTSSLALLVFFQMVMMQASAQTPTELQDSTQTDTTSEDQASSDKPYQVVVTGRLTRSRLRNLIEDVEEDFFAKFNELNLDDAYDMYCYEYTPASTHIKQRACEPVFIIKYRSDQQSLGLLNLTGQAQSVASALHGTYIESPEEAVKNQRRHYEILIQKMEALTQSNQELGEIADAMRQLKLRLENYGTTN